MLLPIDPLLPEIVAHLRAAPNLVIEAEPGAGKTTRVPSALLDALPGHILVLEPRRIAARLAARFVSASLGETVGGTVGYQVRFEEVASARTRLRFLTEGVLTRRLLSDRTLEGVSAVVLDEFHERHLEGDLALALLRRLQLGPRPDLRLVVMSATIDAAPIAAYLGGAGIVRAPGRQYPLEIEYTPHSAAPLEARVAEAVERLAAGGASGHTLVFLPGAYEIRRARDACAGVARRWGRVLHALHGDQSPEEQDRAVGPSEQPKIILSTNVAESSVTIDGVAAVIDSGLARVARHSAWSGLASLDVARISQASANQRAGRAGRTGPGRAIRLYPLEDFVRRPASDAPEIVRGDLAPAALLLRGMGIDHFDDLDWLDAPPPETARHAFELLAMLGADGATLREMARYPLHPRLARLIIEARRRGVAEDGCTVAALLSAGARLPARPAHATRSDVLALLEGEWEPSAAQVVRQVRRLAKPPRQNGHDEDALLLSVLVAFPDRVARRRKGADLQMASGQAAQLAPSSTVTEAELLVAVEAEARRDQAAPLVRLASGIEPEWLLELFPGRLREQREVEWNRAANRVESVNSLLFDSIAIESRRGEPDPAAAAGLLARKAIEGGLARFADAAELAALQLRAEVAGVALPSAEDALSNLAVGLTSLAELEAVAGSGGLLRAMERGLDGHARRRLEELAPLKVRLARGRELRVHYEPGQPPWIASRLQDFFGMKETPRAGGQPLVVRLLAPSQRPVQTTTDLAGFWERLYPQLRRELSRRYPKHAWPEDPHAR